MKKFLPLVPLLILTVSIIGQPTERINYQAIIRDADNQLVKQQPVSSRISVLKGSASGAVLYMESHKVTTNESGLISLDIGGGANTTGSYTSINWGEGIYFLRTETDPTGGSNYTITGTSQMLRVP